MCRGVITKYPIIEDWLIYTCFFFFGFQGEDN